MDQEKDPVECNVQSMPRITGLVSRKLLAECGKNPTAIAKDAVRLDAALRFFSTSESAMHKAATCAAMMGWKESTIRKVVGWLEAQGVKRIEGSWTLELPHSKSLRLTLKTFVPVPSSAIFNLSSQEFYGLTQLHEIGEEVPRAVETRDRVIPLCASLALLPRKEMVSVASDKTSDKPAARMRNLTRLLRVLDLNGYYDRATDQLVGGLEGKGVAMAWGDTDPFQALKKKDWTALRGAKALPVVTKRKPKEPVTNVPLTIDLTASGETKFTALERQNLPETETKFTGQETIFTGQETKFTALQLQVVKGRCRDLYMEFRKQLISRNARRRILSVSY